MGSPGVGKTFLAQILGWRACQANVRVLFTTAMEMLNHLLASQVDHSLVRKLKVYTEPTALIVDELGYLALDQQTSNLFYQVISTRHGHKRSTIITTNTAFSDWGNILYNTTIAAAIADRLVENSEIFLLGEKACVKLRRARHLPLPEGGFFSGAALCDSPSPEESGGRTPQRRCRWGGGETTPAPCLPPCSTSAPITCSCFRGRSTGRVRCCCCSTATPSASIACMTSPKPTTSCLARPIAWRAKSTAPINSTW